MPGSCPTVDPSLQHLPLSSHPGLSGPFPEIRARDAHESDCVSPRSGLAGGVGGGGEEGEFEWRRNATRRTTRSSLVISSYMEMSADVDR